MVPPLVFANYTILSVSTMKPLIVRAAFRVFFGFSRTRKPSLAPVQLCAENEALSMRYRRVLLPFLYKSLEIHTILAEFVGQRWTNESSISACTYEGTEKEVG